MHDKAIRIISTRHTTFAWPSLHNLSELPQRLDLARRRTARDRLSSSNPLLWINIVESETDDDNYSDAAI